MTSGGPHESHLERIPGWWQLTYFFMFTPIPGEDVHPFWRANIFSKGLVKNHQLEKLIEGKIRSFLPKVGLRWFTSFPGVLMPSTSFGLWGRIWKKRLECWNRRGDFGSFFGSRKFGGKSKLHGNVWSIFKQFPTIDASPLFGGIHHDLWIHLLGFVFFFVCFSSVLSWMGRNHDKSPLNAPPFGRRFCSTTSNRPHHFPMNSKKIQG